MFRLDFLTQFEGIFKPGRSCLQEGIGLKIWSCLSRDGGMEELSGEIVAGRDGG